jgi:uncharacterized protein YcfL
MKKLLFILTIFAMFATMSCGSESTTSESTDQTEVMDSTSTTEDSIAVQVDTSSLTGNDVGSSGISAHEQPVK